MCDLLEECDAWRGMLDTLTKLRHARRAEMEECGMAAAITSEGGGGDSEFSHRRAWVTHVLIVLLLRFHGLAALVWFVFVHTLLYHCSVTHYTIKSSLSTYPLRLDHITKPRSKSNSPARP